MFACCLYLTLSSSLNRPRLFDAPKFILIQFFTYCYKAICQGNKIDYMFTIQKVKFKTLREVFSDNEAYFSRLFYRDDNMG